jgi:cell filamentation protein
MYEAGNDPYCYPGTSVLRNRLNLRTASEVEKFETFMTAQRAREPLPLGRLSHPGWRFSYDRYRAIHRHLFQDVYRWAGRIRTVEMSKGGNRFCRPDYIEGEMSRLFDRLRASNDLRDLEQEAFAAEAAHVLAELNAIHPFREGNGRTQNIFLAILADRAGHPLDMERLDPTALLRAMVASFAGEERPLAQVIRALMRSP